jgi:hypothetical protein
MQGMSVARWACVVVLAPTRCSTVGATNSWRCCGVSCCLRVAPRQVSISEVLSSAGERKSYWTTLLRNATPVGEVKVSMTFQRQVDLDKHAAIGQEHRSLMRMRRSHQHLGSTLSTTSRRASALHNSMRLGRGRQSMSLSAGRNCSFDQNQIMVSSQACCRALHPCADWRNT